MIKIAKYTLYLLLMACSECTFNPSITTVVPETTYSQTLENPTTWDIHILQDGMNILPKNDEFPLHSAPFTLPKPLAVGVNVWINNRNFQDIPFGQKLLGDDNEDFLTTCLRDDKTVLPFCKGTGTAEGFFNSEQRLSPSLEFFHYIYYYSENEHRWSRVDINAVQTTFERDVAFIGEIPTSNFTGKLYFTIFVNDNDQDIINEGELKKIVLTFHEP